MTKQYKYWQVKLQNEYKALIEALFEKYPRTELRFGASAVRFVEQAIRDLVEREEKLAKEMEA